MAAAALAAPAPRALRGLDMYGAVQDQPDTWGELDLSHTYPFERYKPPRVQTSLTIPPPPPPPPSALCRCHSFLVIFERTRGVAGCRFAPGIKRRRECELPWLGRGRQEWMRMHLTNFMCVFECIPGWVLMLWPGQVVRGGGLAVCHAVAAEGRVDRALRETPHCEDLARDSPHPPKQKRAA